jgi:hypothetical protein
MSTNPLQPRTINNIIAAQPGVDGIYMILTIYVETDALNAVGQLVRTPWTRGEAGSAVLNTNDTLGSLWASPTGSLWIGSARGNVWTTAGVNWTPHRMQGLVFDALDGRYQWNVTTLPNLKKGNYVPNVTALWGTGDSDVFAATFDGPVYHWDGRAWTEQETDVTTGLNHLHGSGPGDVFCVGDRGVVLHYDGSRWSRVPFPGDSDTNTALTGVRAVSADEVFICGRGGKILHGGHRGLELIAEYPTSFYGLAYFQKRIFLAGGDSGVWELKGNRAEVLKGTFGAVGVFETGNLLVFVEPAQEPRHRIIEYDPANAGAPWWRRTF